jgi:prepilin peptidase CpaA
MVIELVRLLVFPGLLAFAAASDLLTLTISNRISLALAAAFLVLALACGLSAQAIVWHLAAGTLVLAAGFVLFARGLAGGGDAKLAAAIALWFGFDRLVDYALLSGLLGGALTLAILMFRLLPLPRWLARQEWVAQIHQLDAGVPYGIALATAALAIYPSTNWMPA